MGQMIIIAGGIILAALVLAIWRQLLAALPVLALAVVAGLLLRVAWAYVRELWYAALAVWDMLVQDVARLTRLGRRAEQSTDEGA